MIINQIYRNGKDCGQIGDRMSDKDRPLDATNIKPPKKPR